MIARHSRMLPGDTKCRQKNTKVFWHQSEVRTAATVWNWSGKTLSPGALLAVLYFFSCHIFSARLDFRSPPLSAPGSPRMEIRRCAHWNCDTLFQDGGEGREISQVICFIFRETKFFSEKVSHNYINLCLFRLFL